MTTDKKPPKPRELTVMQLRFMAEYIIDFNGTQAAIRAGYSQASASEAASKLLKHPQIAAYVDAVRAKVREKLAEKAVIASDRTQAAMAGMAYVDPLDFVRPDGTSRPITELPERARAAIQGFKTSTKKVGGKTVVETEYRLINRVAAVDMAAKVTGEYKADNEQRRVAREMTNEQIRERMMTLMGLTPETKPPAGTTVQ